MTETPFHSDHHRRLNVLAGAWETTITMLNPDGTAGDVSRASDIYTWMPNGHFLVHDVDAMMGAQHVQSTEIFGVDIASGAFFSRSYDPDGSTNDFTSGLMGSTMQSPAKFSSSPDASAKMAGRLTDEWQQRVDEACKPFVRITLEKIS